MPRSPSAALAAGSSGELQRPGQCQLCVGQVAQRGQEADPVAVAPNQISLRGPSRHGPGLDQGVKASVSPPGQINRAERRGSPQPDRRQDAIFRLSAGIAVQIDQLDARMAEDVP